MNKIDWLQAKKDYVEDCTLSYQDIARRFGVSKKQVGLRAKAEGWLESRHYVHENGYKKFENNRVDSLAEINQRHARQYYALQEIACMEIARIQVQIEESDVPNAALLIDPHLVLKLAQILKIAIDGERIIVGLPTVPIKAEPERPSNDPFSKMSEEELTDFLNDSLLSHVHMAKKTNDSEFLKKLQEELDQVDPHVGN